ncbi:hypothetical protein TRFO_33138 [Tritrichomonas foetus]|uniref:Leucine Rich Repeat family protein n=1 Tax=Tritrichomonas foetus TaxID=1144522 RepID=A0A1J4JM93_9EUKA|nr:hypothetical protein TRFO_33138 [Tritrichomonas foetus]|eukprot:OHT00223.1 hypothetical protein TRFO_33138 [Tritrichomonas foetus]
MNVDLSSKDLRTVSPTDIPFETLDLDLSNNKIERLPENVFQEKSKLWNVNLSNNLLNDLSFAKHFTSLGIFDLRNNNLSIDELLDIFHIYIMHLKLDGNDFSSKINSNLLLPAILTRVWIIDGIFISDYTRKLAKSYKESLSFGEEILCLRKVKYKKNEYAGVNNTAQNFLNGTSIKFSELGSFICKNGVLLQNNNDQPQIHRLNLLMQFFPPEIPEGTFSEYFGLALGILAYLWLQIPIDIIPRIVCGNYWLIVIKEIEKMEQFQFWLVLMKISQNVGQTISPDDEINQNLWDCLAVPYFLQTGEIPKPGSTPRLLLTAYIERSPDAPELPDLDDRFLYQKLRKSGKFESWNPDFETVYGEILGILPVVSKDNPEKGDEISLRHPFTDQWVTGKIISFKKGRVFIKLEYFIVQLPVLSVFWDGRGCWREALPTIDPLPPIQNEENNENEDKKKSSTIRAKSEIKQVEHDKSYRVGVFNPLTSLRRTTGPASVYSTISRTSNFSTLRKTGNSQKSKMSTMNSANHGSTSNTNARPTSQLLQTFVTDGSSQRNTLPTAFIGDPVKPPRKPVMLSPPSRRPNQYVQDVVNIVFGQDIGGGRKLRKFNVRTENPLTKKSQYIWVNEDEISTEDVQRLVGLFRKHIESKMTIIPGL